MTTKAKRDIKRKLNVIVKRPQKVNLLRLNYKSLVLLKE
jgi:hypothetical protein